MFLNVASTLPRLGSESRVLGERELFLLRESFIFCRKVVSGTPKQNMHATQQTNVHACNSDQKNKQYLVPSSK